MIVCIDIQSAIGQRAGVGRYTRSLSEHLGERRGADSLRLFFFDFRRRGLPFAVEHAELKSVRWCPGRLMQKSWNVFRSPPFDRLAGRADLYHFPNFIIPPLEQGRSVVTIHDVSFLAYPDFAETRNLAWITRRIFDTVERADAIITDSLFSAGEIGERLSVKAERIFPIHLGLAKRFAPVAPEEITRMRKEFGLHGPYLLTVGTIEPRKNIEFLISVFERMAGFDGSLVLAGMKGWKYEPILERMKNSTRARDIRHIEYVPDNLLPALYTGAELFVFPSLYEGFGLPPLEAMACGTPVVASAAGSLPEVLGGAAVSVPDFDADAWASITMRAISDSSMRQDLAAGGRVQAARYTWGETARRTWDVYRKAAS